MRWKPYNFGCKQSIIKGTLLGEQCGESLSENKLGGPIDWWEDSTKIDLRGTDVGEGGNLIHVHKKRINSKLL